MNSKIIREATECIKYNDLVKLQELYVEYFIGDSENPSTDRDKPYLNETYIFKTLISNAFLYERKEILGWFWNIYQQMDTISKLALKPTWLYGKSLVFKKNKDIYNWVNDLELKYIN